MTDPENATGPAPQRSQSEWAPFIAAAGRPRLNTRRMAQATRQLFTTSRTIRDLEAGAHDFQLDTRQGMRIAVTSARGGAGKTTTTALIGSLLASHRQDPIVAVDGDFVTGSLTARLGILPQQTLPDLAKALGRGNGTPASPEDIARLLPRTASGLWLVPGSAGGGVADLRAVTRVLDKAVAIGIVDCGPDLTIGNAARLLTDAHSIIVVAPATPDGLRSTFRELERIGRAEGGPEILSRVTVALNPIVPGSATGFSRSRIRNIFTQLRARVVSLHHDSHLATGGPIDFGLVSEPCVLAATQLVTAALERAEKT